MGCGEVVHLCCPNGCNVLMCLRSELRFCGYRCPSCHAEMLEVVKGDGA